MQSMTLAELKAKNSSEGEAATVDTVVVEQEQEAEPAAEAEAVTTETTETTDTGDAEELDGVQDEGEQEEVEAWMVSGEEGSPDDKPTVALSDHIQLRQKLKHEKRDLQSELDELKQKVAQYESGAAVTTAQPEAAAPPKLEDFDYDEAKYAQAVTAWSMDQVDNRISHTQQAKQQEEQQRLAQERQKQSVDSHYQRAQGLLNKSGISAEVYQQADRNVRQAIENAMPGAGEAVADTLIANIGEGSEKVMYAIGRNPTLAAEMQAKLTQDPTGLQAAIWVGEKKAELVRPVKRKTQAPKPAAQLSGGDGAGKSQSSEAALKRKYKDADKKNDPQARFAARRAAKKAGFDVNNW